MHDNAILILEDDERAGIHLAALSEKPVLVQTVAIIFAPNFLATLKIDGVSIQYLIPQLRQAHDNGAAIFLELS